MRVGVDVGGTTVKVGFVDNYEIVDRLVVKTKKETLFDDVFKAIKKFLKYRTGGQFTLCRLQLLTTNTLKLKTHSVL